MESARLPSIGNSNSPRQLLIHIAYRRCAIGQWGEKTNLFSCDRVLKQGQMCQVGQGAERFEIRQLSQVILSQNQCCEVR